MMVMKHLIRAVLVLLPVHCLYAGDSCIYENREGTCRQLRLCSSWLAVIRAGGSPMPSHIRRRLQAATCGFEDIEPLVCCSPESIAVEDGFVSDQGIATHDCDRSNEDDSWDNAVNSDHHWHKPHTHKPHTYHHYGNNNDFNKNDQSPNTFTNNNKNDSSKVNVDTIVDEKGQPDIRNHRNLNLLPTNCGAIEDNRIWGGNRTALYEMPWMVLIAYDSPRGTKLSCGGTLVTRWYILTAAHCVSHLGSRLSLRGAVLGEHDVRGDPDCERNEGELHCSPSARNVSFDQVIPHPGYSPQNLFDDIALVRLAEPADFTLDNMKPICLPTTQVLQNENLTGVQGVVAGWGATEDGLQSPVLLRVELPVVSNEDCRATYNGNPHIYERQLCAGGIQDKDSCGGDSGGPLMYPGRTGSSGIRYVQRGVVSFGSKRCGVGGFPGVYTRISNYMDWILDNIRD